MTNSCPGCRSTKVQPVLSLHVGWRVLCSGCLMMGPIGVDQTDAENRWNRLPRVSDLDAEMRYLFDVISAVARGAHDDEQMEFRTSLSGSWMTVGGIRRAVAQWKNLPRAEYAIEELP